MLQASQRQDPGCLSFFLKEGPGSGGYLYLPLALYIMGGGTPLSLSLAFSLSSVFCRKSESLRTVFLAATPLGGIKHFIYLFIYSCKTFATEETQSFFNILPLLSPHLTILLFVPNINISAVKRRDRAG